MSQHEGRICFPTVRSRSCFGAFYTDHPAMQRPSCYGGAPCRVLKQTVCFCTSLRPFISWRFRACLSLQTIVWQYDVSNSVQMRELA